MFEHTSKAAQMLESRAANSMYQIIDGLVPPNSAKNGNNSAVALPRAEVVKYLTDSVTRRIQELWTAMQEMASNDAYIPCAERIRVAVADLTAVFPGVSWKLWFSLVNHENVSLLSDFSQSLMKLCGMPLCSWIKMQTIYRKTVRTWSNRFMRMRSHRLTYACRKFELLPTTWRRQRKCWSHSFNEEMASFFYFPMPYFFRL